MNNLPPKALTAECLTAILCSRSLKRELLGAACSSAQIGSDPSN
ncbi:hypothetical protein [Hydrogenophaga sp.]|nr:hypothetical protein [Hydrogenophaga sp.]